MTKNLPVLVGLVPLFKVQSYVVTEGYKTAAVGGSGLIQMVAPTSKTVAIEAFLVDEERALRPALEAMAMTSRALASLTAKAMSVTGIPVISERFIHLDMQITSLAFTQDNQNRNTLKVTLQLTNVPRPKLGGLLGLLDVGLGVASGFY